MIQKVLKQIRHVLNQIPQVIQRIRCLYAKQIGKLLGTLQNRSIGKGVSIPGKESFCLHKRQLKQSHDSSNDQRTQNQIRKPTYRRGRLPLWQNQRILRCHNRLLVDRLLRSRRRCRNRGCNRRRGSRLRRYIYIERSTTAAAKGCARLIRFSTFTAKHNKDPTFFFVMVLTNG